MQKNASQSLTTAKIDKVKKETFSRRAFFVNEMKKNSYILRSMVKKNFKAQYRGSILGALWTVLNPLLNMIVLSFVFSKMFGGRPGVGIYPIYLLCGNIIFNILNQVSTQSLGCLIFNSGLIKKAKIAYAIFPTSTVFMSLVNFSLSFVAMLIVMLIVKQPFYWTILLTVTIVPAVSLFSLGIGFALSSMFVFFRDVKHLYSVFLTLWHYLTPIFYTADSLGDGLVTKFIALNPMTVFVTSFRDIIQWGTVPSGMTFLIMYAWGIGMALLGYFIFRFNRKKYILYI